MQFHEDESEPDPFRLSFTYRYIPVLLECNLISMTRSRKVVLFFTMSYVQIWLTTSFFK